ncbi:Vascular endothelial growth factor A [Channa argus]|uniref:Vascular endothelial growth factor A n=1 Tax=Channa argus TaxID=215402 RepID=A0A6G1QJW8_CHAAH|nr:Vascular endothelial growth factor A [Channa argus]
MQVYNGLASFFESHLVLILLLQPVLAQITPIPEENSPRVIQFMDVYAKSVCQPMEQLVNLVQEFPGEVEYTYIPDCVPLKRCSGFCGDERKECYPTLKSNITLQLKRVISSAYPPSNQQEVELTFVEHQRCGYRDRQNMEKPKRAVSIKTKPRRKNDRKTTGKCRDPKKRVDLY